MNRSRTEPASDSTSLFGLLDDVPITTNASDLLGFDSLAQFLANRIGETPDKAADVFGLYGPWGSGKSSCLALLRKRIPDDVAWLDFDALKYQANEGVLLPLIHHLAAACGTGTATDFFWGMTKSIANFLVDVVVATSPYKHEVGKLVESIKAIPSSMPQSKDQLPPSRSVMIERTFDELLKHFLKLKNQKRLVVAVDNLDRCTPLATLELIEAIHLLLRTESATFILAMDFAACSNFVSKQYGHTASESSLYLEKMIPDYFRVPEPWITDEIDPDNPDCVFRYISGLLSLKKCRLIKKQEKLLWAVAGATTLLRNPRRIKRLIRQLALFDEEFWADHHELVEATIFVVVLSDIWPGLLRQFPLMWPQDWENLIMSSVRRCYGSNAGADLFDKAFDEFVVAITQWRVEGKDIDEGEVERTQIADYDVIDGILTELQKFGM